MKSCDAFIERDHVAPKGKAKIPIQVAPLNGIFDKLHSFSEF